MIFCKFIRVHTKAPVHVNPEAVAMVDERSTGGSNITFVDGSNIEVRETVEDVVLSLTVHGQRDTHDGH